MSSIIEADYFIENSAREKEVKTKKMRDEKEKVFMKVLCTFLFSSKCSADLNIYPKSDLIMLKVGGMECPGTGNVLGSLICCFVTSQSQFSYV